MFETLHIITGPTAVGKTAFALEYAEENGAEIVSCDASLVYRGMDIGTAKPSSEELQRVPHHMIDVCRVDTPYNIAQFHAGAQLVVESIRSRGKAVVVTGGSGLYLKSFLAPVVDSVEVDPSVRQSVETLYATAGLEGLLKKLEEVSPQGFGSLDVRNPRRVIRALERCLCSGKSLPELQAEFAARPEPYPGHKKKIIMLERDPDVLKDRIRIRAEKMLQGGLIEEVRELIAAGIEKNPGAASAIGYRETLAYIKGGIERSELIPMIVQNTIHLVKKQRTWFRTQIREPDERITL
ncbi:MAG: tRNA (adenosine(37)-N6)-dimethylallyltransferase MiaA [Verrucomicrobiota bacterium]